MPTADTPVAVLFEKLAVTPAAEQPNGRKPCGFTWRHKLGPEHQVRSGSNRLAQVAADITSRSEFPALSSCSSQGDMPKKASHRSWGKLQKQAKYVNAQDGSRDHLVYRSEEELWEDPAEMEMRKAVDASINEADEDAVKDNGPLSRKLLKSKECNAVRLYELSRDPEAVYRAFAESADLQRCIATLKQRGFDPLLAGGASAFVQPEEFEAVKEWIRFHNFSTKPRHVFASTEFEEPLMSAVRSIPCKEKVRCKESYIVPLSFLQAVHDGKIPAIKFRTFLHIPTPSSLRSRPASGPVVASTTDARGVPNPRRA